MRFRIAVSALFIITSLFGSAQDSTFSTITVKKNKKHLKSMGVFNAPKFNSPEKDAVQTEWSNYDQDGNLSSHFNFHQNTLEKFIYDKSGRPVLMSTDNTFLKTEISYDTLEYDASGKLKRKVRIPLTVQSTQLYPWGDTSKYAMRGVEFCEDYRYDDAGKLVWKINKMRSQYSYFTYKYDSAGNQVEERAVSVRYITYGKGGMGGRVDSLIVINKNGYDAMGNQVSETTYNTGGETLRSRISKFDSKNRITETQIFDASFSLIQKFEYFYDKNDDMIKQLCYDYFTGKDKKQVQNSESKITYKYEYY